VNPPFLQSVTSTTVSDGNRNRRYFATVRNRTARLPSKCHDACMLNKKESDNATRASIKKEMAKPRMAKSVRVAELILNAERTSQARTTVPGTVDKIIPILDPSQKETAQIVVKGADDRDLRIENTLIDENGAEVRLKKGAHVEVTVTAKAEQ
jgi:hypothetical protein